MKTKYCKHCGKKINKKHCEKCGYNNEFSDKDIRFIIKKSLAIKNILIENEIQCRYCKQRLKNVVCSTCGAEQDFIMRDYL